MKPAISCTFTVCDGDPLVSQHRVQDIHILPGVALLDAVYKSLLAAGVDPTALVLTGIRFHEPVVTNAQLDRLLTVRVDLRPGVQQIRVSSVPCRAQRVLNDTTTTHMTCAVEARELWAAESPLLPELPASSFDLDQCYAVARRIGIHHDDFMKCRGRYAELPSGDVIAQLSLSNSAAVSASDFSLHPVFLDCGSVVALCQPHGVGDDASLFIPVAIERFWAEPFSSLQVSVLAQKPAGSSREREVLRQSFDIFDDAGVRRVRAENFSVKRVRSLASIRHLLEASSSPKSNGAHVAAPGSTSNGSVAANGSAAAHDGNGGRQSNGANGHAPALPVAAQAGQRVQEILAELIAHHGKREWQSSDAQREFFELGLDSMALLDISEALERRLSIKLHPTLLFECPTPAAVIRHLLENFPTVCAQQPQPAAPPATKARSPNGAHSLGANGAQSPGANGASHGARRESEREAGLSLLVPRWLPLTEPLVPGHAGRAALVSSSSCTAPCERLMTALGERLRFSSCGEASAPALARALAEQPDWDELWLLGYEHEELFPLLVGLASSGRLSSLRAVKAITVGGFKVHDDAPAWRASHGLWGLLQTLSREYPRLRVTQVDLAPAELEALDQSAWSARLRLLDGAGQQQRQLLAIRGESSYVRRLLPAEAPEGETPWRQGGVYLLIGGAGGVGIELASFLRRRYGARVALMGRSPLSDSVEGKLAQLGRYGQDVLYVRGSVEDEAAVRTAIDQTRNCLGGLHGVIHSAMVLEDHLLAALDPAAFERVLAPKVAGMEALARATAGLELDFLLLFSSIQSFIGNVGQGNYACACTAMDGMAAALRAQRAYPIVVINWGFWSDVGAVSTPRYRELMARQGVFGLRSEEALEALERVLAAGWEQAAILAAAEPVLEEMGYQSAPRLLRAPESSTPLPSIAPVDALFEAYRPTCEQIAEAMPQLLELARSRIISILRSLSASGELDDSALAPSGQIAERHAPWLRAVLTHLKTGGPLDAPGATATEFAQAAGRLELERPALRSLIRLLATCIEAYPEWLRGKTTGMAILFPSGSDELVRSVYADNPFSHFYNRVLAAAVVALAQRDPVKPLRILEVGAGTGATLRQVLAGLAEASLECEYTYTDLWERLVTNAKGRFGSEHPQTRFAFLDISSDPAAQGFSGEFDVVIATNVLHATADLRASLQHVKQLLAPRGHLLLNESVLPQEFSTYTFGLLPGWWHALDSSLRWPGTPLASDAQWQSLLLEAGFHPLRTLISSDAEAPALGAQQVYLAQSDGELRSALQPAARLRASMDSELPPALRHVLKPHGGGQQTLGTYLDGHGNDWLFLRNPPANTFTEQLLSELLATLGAIATAPRAESAGRLVYLSHIGNYFSLGGDREQLLQHLQAGDAPAISRFAEQARLLLQALTSLDALVVAVVNGTAQGGGFETLLATDLQIVRQGTKLGLPEIKSGLIPGMGGLTHLRERVGPAWTKRLVMLGELIDAEQAQQLGLVSHVVSDPYATALALSNDVAHVGAAMVMKRILNRGSSATLTADIEEWVSYVTHKADWINRRRISDSSSVLASLASVSRS